VFKSFASFVVKSINKLFNYFKISITKKKIKDFQKLMGSSILNTHHSKSHVMKESPFLKNFPLNKNPNRS
jgi:hypothetical protein